MPLDSHTKKLNNSFVAIHPRNAADLIEDLRRGVIQLLKQDRVKVRHCIPGRCTAIDNRPHISFAVEVEGVRDVMVVNIDCVDIVKSIEDQILADDLSLIKVVPEIPNDGGKGVLGH